MKVTVWPAAIAVALLAAGCGVIPTLTAPSGAERATAKEPLLVPQGQPRAQRVRTLLEVPLCPPDGFPDGAVDGYVDGYVDGMIDGIAPS